MIIFITSVLTSWSKYKEDFPSQKVTGGIQPQSYRQRGIQWNWWIFFTMHGGYYGAKLDIMVLCMILSCYAGYYSAMLHIMIPC